MPPPAGQTPVGAPPATQPPPAPPASSGFGDLQFEQISPPSGDFAPPLVPKGSSRFRVQVLAIAALKSALAAREEVAKVVEEPVYVEPEQQIWKVRVGDLPDRQAADTLRRRLVGLGYEDAFVIEARGR